MNRPLRIAMFVGCFPVISETFILRQIAGLLELGHAVDIYADTRAADDAPRQPEVIQHQLIGRTTYMDMPPEMAPWEMPVFPLAGKTWVPGAAKPVANWRRVARALPAMVRCAFRAPRLTLQVLRRAEFGYQAASLSALHRLAKLASESRRYDVLHAHFGPVGNSFRFARRLWDTPMVISFHGYDFTSVPRKQGVEVYRKLFVAADLITVNSNYMGQHIQPMGCPPEKIRTLSYGIDVAKYRFKPRTVAGGEPVRLLTIGRLIEKKGIEFALRSVARVARHYPQMRYDVVGDGPMRERLQGVAEEEGIAGLVRFHGALDGGAVCELLDRAHVFVLASVTAEDGDQEGTPVSLLEAQAVGLPVLSTLHSGIPEIVLNNQSGLLVPERDVEELAAGLQYMVEHPERWAKFGRNGRANIEAHFAAPKCMADLLNIYLEVLPKSHAARSSCGPGAAHKPGSNL
jgi:colanic acid/amylovoran biosynthesis glycosyltransferase